MNATAHTTNALLHAKNSSGQYVALTLNDVRPIYNITVTDYTVDNNPTQIIYRDSITNAEVYRENFTYNGAGLFLTKTVVWA